MKRKRVPGFRAAWLAGALLVGACHLYRMERKLDPPSAAFLSQVNWIITRQERKVFLELPDAERPAFIDAFWQRRDPDPASAENEYRDVYEMRVAEAARLFRNENKPGWLTDRGRILILFGLPDERRTVPSVSSSAASCFEEWHYGTFPVLFIDRDCNGDFRLETHDLSLLRSTNLDYMHELGRAQNESLAPGRPQQALFDFGVRLQVTQRSGERLSGLVHLQLPLAPLTFRREGDLHSRALEVTLEFRDHENEVVWTSRSNPEVQLKSADLKPGTQRPFHSLQVPFDVTGANRVGRLAPGAAVLLLTLTVPADGLTLRKQVELK